MSLFVRLGIERAFCHRCSRSATAPSTYQIPHCFLKTASFKGFATKGVVSVNQADTPKCPNVLERNKLQDYLNLVASTNELTAEDIERHKPSKHAPPGTTQYESDYEKVVKLLSRSFTVKQLKDGHRLFGLELPRKKTKRELAVSIIERQWRWPSLSESLKQRRDRTEVISQSFPLSKREAFLLLGKDGSNLHKLSSKYNVQTSFSSNPLSLTVQGARGSVGKVARYIHAFMQDIAEDELELPTEQEIPSKLCQRVSRLSGALVECQDRTTQIAYHTKELRARYIAKALLMQGAYESATQPPLLVCVSKDNPLPLSMNISETSHGFFLYPFTPTRPLPWIVGKASMLRPRDVGGWFDHNAMKKPTLLSRDNVTTGLDRQADDIRERLFAMATNLGTERIPDTTVQVSFGHHLFRSPSASFDVLTSHAAKEFTLVDLLDRISELEQQRVFSPSIPKQILDTRPGEERLIHRLVYHAIPPDTPDRPVSDFIKLEFGHDIAGHSRVGLPGGETNEQADSLLQGRSVNFDRYCCWRESVSKLDLILPERSMDIRFSVPSIVAMPESKWPQELLKYKDSLEDLSTSSLEAARGSVPLTFSHDNVTFAFRSSVLVRQSIDFPLSTGDGSTSPPVVSESVVDLNSNQRYTTCKMTCEQPFTDNAWRSLMLASDWLTAQEKSDVLYNSRHLVDVI